MSAYSAYNPPGIWKWEQDNGGKFAQINRPTAGPTHEKELPAGKHPLQLYSLGTPNGNKVTIMLEELLALGHTDAEYDAWLVNILEGEQFSTGFVAINPNSKIPAMVDMGTTPPTRIFESGSILLYLAEKFDAFLPHHPQNRVEVLNWLFWHMAASADLGGGFGHFYAYAPEKFEYPINRYTMEVKRQLDVLNRQLSTHEFIAGSEYSIADMAIFPWYGELVKGKLYNAGEFLSVHEYQHVIRWAELLLARKPVQRGRMVNRIQGDLSEQLRERHSASDFENKTQDKLSSR
ncbi:glutathione-dependent disulfide-bond oxidoreductase [Acidihalobacter prosperus]